MAWNINRWAIGCGLPGTARPGGRKALQPPAWKSAGWLLAGLAFSGSADAASEMGPSSSASINITVSAAPRYALRPAAGPSQGRLKHADPSQFCLETNAMIPQLPVMLIWPSEPATDNMVEVPPCGAHRGTVQPVDRRGQVGSGLLIVRPE